MSLLEQVASFEQLKKAWFYIKSKGRVTPGVDDESLFVFSASLDQNLQSISSSLINKKYTINKVRAAKIPKNKLSPPEEKRTINIYTVRDKVVQKSLLISIEKYFPGIKNSISVGFIHNFSGVSMAVERIKKYFKLGFNLLITADIENFFDNIDRKSLSNIIYKSLSPDNSLNWLIEQCLNPIAIKKDIYGSLEILLADTGSGVAQGSILAPFFSNVYMIEFDRDLEKNGVKAIRYADDLAIMSNSDKKADELLKTAKHLINKYGLRFHPEDSEKAPRINSLRYYANFLGLRLQVQKKSSWIIQPTDKKIKYMDAILSMTLNDVRIPFYKRLEKINQKIEGWYNTYRYSKCTRHELRLIYRKTKKKLEYVVNSLLKRERIVNKDLDSKKVEFFGIPSIKKIDQLLIK